MGNLRVNATYFSSTEIRVQGDPSENIWEKKQNISKLKTVTKRVFLLKQGRKLKKDCFKHNK